MPLAEVADVIRGVTFQKDDVSDFFALGRTPIIRAGNIRNELELGRDLIWVPSSMVSPNQLMRPGDIAMCASSGSAKVVGKSALLRRTWGGAVGAFCVIIRPKSTYCDHDFLAFFFRSAKFREWTQNAAGASIKNIRKSDLEDFLVPLPPLNEQRRIVGILNRATKIERLRAQAADRLREFILALFVKMFGDEDRIASSFRCLPLKRVAAIGSGATKGRKIDPSDAVEVPYLRVANVQDGYLNLEEIKTIIIRRGEEEKYALANGDLVMTEGGDPDKLGRAAIWRGQLEYCAHQNHVFRVRPDNQFVLTDYLRDVVGSAYGKAYFLSVAKQTTGIASINKSQLGNFPVPMPPIELQVRYGSTIARYRKIGATVEYGAATAATLSSSLMSRLLGDAS